MLKIKTVRLLLQLDEDDISDEDLQEYIEHFSLLTIAKLGEVAKMDESIQSNELFKQAVMAAIACQLSLTDIAMVHTPSGYKVGDTSEDFDNTSMGLYGSLPSWCDLYSDYLADLVSQYNDIANVRVFRRKGMSVRRQWLHDLW